MKVCVEWHILGFVAGVAAVQFSYDYANFETYNKPLSTAFKQLLFHLFLPYYPLNFPYLPNTQSRLYGSVTLESRSFSNETSSDHFSYVGLSFPLSNLSHSLSLFNGVEILVFSFYYHDYFLQNIVQFVLMYFHLDTINILWKYFIIF